MEEKCVALEILPRPSNLQDGFRMEQERQEVWYNGEHLGDYNVKNPTIIVILIIVCESHWNNKARNLLPPDQDQTESDHPAREILISTLLQCIFFYAVSIL